MKSFEMKREDFKSELEYHKAMLESLIEETKKMKEDIEESAKKLGDMINPFKIRDINPFTGKPYTKWHLEFKEKLLNDAKQYRNQAEKLRSGDPKETQIVMKICYTCMNRKKCPFKKESISTKGSLCAFMRLGRYDKPVCDDAIPEILRLFPVVSDSLANLKKFKPCKKVPFINN